MTMGMKKDLLLEQGDCGIVQKYGGYYLVLPKYGNGLMLLMEWVASYHKPNLIHSVKNSDEYFLIRLNAKFETYKCILSYIVANS
jgi:hypothetical protein